MNISVIKRDGELVNFDRLKIDRAIEKAYIGSGKSINKEQLNKIVDDIVSEVYDRFSDNEILLNVENLHDIVEKHLMKSGQYEVAKSYIIYRSNKRQKENEERSKISFLKTLNVKKKNGEIVSFNPKKLKDTISRHSKGLDVDQSLIFQETVKSIYDGMKSEDIDKALVLSATSFIEQEPDYSLLSSRFFRQKLAKEVFGKSTESNSIQWEKSYRDSFIKGINEGVSFGIFDNRVGKNFNLTKLSECMVLDRDEFLKYISIQTLYERYLAKINGRRIEMPQMMWMRIAMGLALNESDPTEKAIEFYDLMSRLLYVPSTPTLFHSGFSRPQLSSCYLSTVDDDLKHIFRTYSDNAQMSKWSGGIGNDWTPVRSTGARIKSTMVESQGVVPFLKVANDTTVAINRSGKRRGATAVYLETWHLDIEDFLDLRKNTGDERRRTHDIDTVNWIPDLFMKRVQENGSWTLFSPDEVPDLHEIYGKNFEEKYIEYERRALEGKIRLFKVVDAYKLFRKMLTMLFETGHPWLTFKDPCNIRSPQDHVGVVHNSNLCCVAANQFVVTEKGLLTVKEMYEYQVEGWKLAGKDGFVNSTPMLKPRIEAPMCIIHTKEGYTHKVTPDHKVWVIDKGHVEAKDLLRDDKIALQTTYGLWGDVDDPELAFICGVLVNKGLFGSYFVSIELEEKDKFLIDQLEKCLSVVLSRYECFNNNLNKKKFVLNDKKYVLTCESLFDILKLKRLEHYQYACSSIPQFVRKGNENTVKSYLTGLYLSNAVINKNNSFTVNLKNLCFKLASELQILWSNFGIKTEIIKVNNFLNYDLCHSSIKSCQILEKVTNIGNVFKNTEFLSRISGDSAIEEMYATFTHLENTEYPEDAYCVSVDKEDHLWTVNGILTKNTEITLNTKPTKLNEDLSVKELGEIAVCNLGSLNIMRHMINVNSRWKIDWELLEKSIHIAMRMLDNVIDINFYPVPEARESNLRHRPVGLGYMGLQDALFLADICYEESDDFVDELQEFISYHAILSSSILASQRGVYDSYSGSKWDRGLFPLDTLDMLEKERGMPIEVDRKSRMDWSYVRDHVKKHGMRNSNTMAAAPTATISNIAGILGPNGEAVFKNIFTKSNMSGEFTVINEYLIKDLKNIGLWDKDMLDLIKYHNGSIQKIDKIPLRLRQKYKEVWDIDQKRSIDLTALRAKWIDQSQSHNIFVSVNSGKLLMDIYTYAWKKGLKTTYYLRTLGASGIEKSTLDASKYGLTQKRDTEEISTVKFCKIDDPTCESCQ